MYNISSRLSFDNSLIDMRHKFSVSINMHAKVFDSANTLHYMMTNVHTS